MRNLQKGDYCGSMPISGGGVKVKIKKGDDERVT